MRVLMINKFLYPKGGAETYMLRLGEQLEQAGHTVQYFGMEDDGRCVGNVAQAYAAGMDLHTQSLRAKMTYAVRTVYSAQARRKLRRVLEDFQPDVCHLNNFHYQLTPSVLLEIRRWRKEGHKCRVLYTAHDYQLLCPNHLFYNGTVCEQCTDGHFVHCIENKCIHGSTAKSVIGAAEAYIWNHTDVYETIDTIVCCSEFIKQKLDGNPRFAERTVVLHNFAPRSAIPTTVKKDYVLYFGRYSREKGTDTLLEACRNLPEIPFLFAGEGESTDRMQKTPNVTNIGFQTGEALRTYIREALFTVCPSACYENCPFSVLESIACGTPVLAANTGGLPELVEDGKTGELFESGNVQMLRQKIEKLWNDRELTGRYSRNCQQAAFETAESYTRKILRLYVGVLDKCGNT